MNLTTFESREFRLGAVATLTFATASAFGVLPFSSIEVAGFVTGGICVWLLVRENIWNWPVGIANSALYFVVFLQARLFADSVLQLVFVGLGAAGWWYWLFGGAGRGHRTIGRVRLPEAVVLVAVTALATFGLTQYLRSVHDAAPALDSLTTCLSLAATYLQARKLGCAVLTRNIGDFDLLNQLAPGGQILLYRQTSA